MKVKDVLDKKKQYEDAIQNMPAPQTVKEDDALQILTLFARNYVEMLENFKAVDENLNHL